MAVTNREITEHAKSLGFADVRFARAADIKTSKGDNTALHSILDGAECIIVPFMRYDPISKAARGNIALSPYYIASNKAYIAAKQLASYIQENGADALHTASISAKAAALRTGGFIGDNGFYYHESLGSLVCIQTVLSTAGEPEEYKSSRTECLHCGMCGAGCPSNAIGDTDSCVRAHMHGVVPERLRGDVYQLFGCERCQTVCPLNSREASSPYEFSVKELLSGGGKEKLRELAGGNMARERRIISQSALYAASTSMFELAGDLLLLSETAEDPVKTHALWAYKQLTGDNDDNS